MNLIAKDSIGISFKGKRGNNEDYIFPPLNSNLKNNRFFVVCDGIGGSEKGEEASKLAAETFNEYAKKNHLMNNLI